MTFPKLYKTNNGKQYEWEISLEREPTKIHIHTIYGYVGGSLVKKTKTIEHGKGGRTLFEQAELDAASKWKNKKEKELYSENPIDQHQEEIKIRPMLASTLYINKFSTFPVYVQRKYDGIRCIAYQQNDEIILESRNGIPFPHFHELKSQLIPFFQQFPTIYLDGELYTESMPFETLSGYIRMKKIDETTNRIINTIPYHVYDCYFTENPNMIYDERMRFLSSHLIINPLIHGVITDIANTIEEIKQYHEQYIQEGFEGIMIRIPSGKYELDKRSKYLYKYKEFKEEEFTIVGYHQGDAGEKGCVIWDCITIDEKPFAVRPRGTFEQRKEWFQQGEENIGRKITVIFQEYSQDGVPRFPVGKAIRMDI
jgi:DNA ligase-1